MAISAIIGGIATLLGFDALGAIQNIGSKQRLEIDRLLNKIASENQITYDRLVNEINQKTNDAYMMLSSYDSEIRRIGNEIIKQNAKKLNDLNATKVKTDEAINDYSRRSESISNNNLNSAISAVVSGVKNESKKLAGEVRDAKQNLSLKLNNMLEDYNNGKV